ncbi:hypothetical protein E2C01_045923 [Portunus trituberculatus]|uniref:Uncharacterized protein n=1 Tax=Portunus trituberculatus TaxID=210409 RepID=A0A5B7G489_PORTR|nr:hypothetical protein [Portunus trituberculatus]
MFTILRVKLSFLMFLRLFMILECPLVCLSPSSVSDTRS